METGERSSLQKTDYLISASLFIGTLALLLSTNSAYAMVWDEGFYYPTYKLVSQWFGLLITSPGLAFSYQGIFDHWAEIRELPPITKYLGALSTSLVPFQNPLLSMRLLFMVLFGLTVVLVYCISRLLNPNSTFFTCTIPAIFYLLHPRLFAHGHIAATETVFAFITALSILVVILKMNDYLRISLIIFVIVLACGTKVNGLILCTALFFYYLILIFSIYKSSKEKLEFKKIGFALMLLILAPFLLYFIWPWMWHDTFPRLQEYWSFIRDHAHLGTWYLGNQYNVGEKLIPWHYPIVITLATIPITFFLASLFGIILYMKALLQHKIEFTSPWLYIVLLVLGPYGSMILMGAPKYDGIRLFLPVYIPLGLFIPLFIHRIQEVQSKYYPYIISVFFLLLFIETLPNLRVGLNYYNKPTKLLSNNGAEFPFETAYWMESIHPEVFESMLNDSGKENIRLITRAIHPKVFEIQQEWGLIPQGVLINPVPPYDYHLIQNRRGFWTKVDWWLFENRESLYIDSLQPNEPRFFVYDGRPPYTF
ncbi:MAG: ArnT family glycosyltransferase [Sumerlaeia bacterium]